MYHLPRLWMLFQTVVSTCTWLQLLKIIHECCTFTGDIKAHIFFSNLLFLLSLESDSKCSSETVIALELHISQIFVQALTCKHIYSEITSESGVIIAITPLNRGKNMYTVGIFRVEQKLAIKAPSLECKAQNPHKEGK